VIHRVNKKWAVVALVDMVTRRSGRDAFYDNKTLGDAPIDQPTFRTPALAASRRGPFFRDRKNINHVAALSIYFNRFPPSFFSKYR